MKEFGVESFEDILPKLDRFHFLCEYRYIAFSLDKISTIEELRANVGEIVSVIKRHNKIVNSYDTVSVYAKDEDGEEDDEDNFDEVDRVSYFVKKTASEVGRAAYRLDVSGQSYVWEHGVKTRYYVKVIGLYDAVLANMLSGKMPEKRFSLIETKTA